MTAPFQTDLGISPMRNYASISPTRPSLANDPSCHTMENDKWDNSVWCDETVSMRSILFTNAMPDINFNVIDIRVNLLSTPTDDISAITEDQFSAEPEIIIKKSKDIKNSWAMPFISGRYYNVHWKWGVDFEHLAIAPSRLWNTTDGVVLRFNYTDARELFEIAKWYSAQLQLPYITDMGSIPDPDTCENGDYFQDKLG